MSFHLLFSEAGVIGQMGQLSLFSLSVLPQWKEKLIQWAVWSVSSELHSHLPSPQSVSLITLNLPFDWSIIAPYQVFMSHMKFYCVILG